MADFDHELEMLSAAVKMPSFVARNYSALDAYQWEDPVFEWCWINLSAEWSETGECPGVAWWKERLDEIPADEREPYRGTMGTLLKHESTWPVSAMRSVTQIVVLRDLRKGVDAIDEKLHEATPDVESALDAMTNLTYKAQALLGGVEEKDQDWVSGFAGRILEYEANRTSDSPRFPLPWPSVAKAIRGGIPMASLIEILANTNIGKSAMMAAIGFCSLEKTDWRIVDFRTEDTRSETEARYDAAMLRLDRQVLLTGDYGEDEPAVWARIMAKNAEKLMGRLWVHAIPPGTTVAQIRAKLVKHREEVGDMPILALVDMSDDLRSERSRDSGHEDIEDVFSALLGMSKDEKLQPLAVVVSKHAHRASEGKMPGTGNVGGGYAAAQRPDAVFGVRDIDISDVSHVIPPNRKDVVTQAIEIGIEKNRLGRVKKMKRQYACNLGSLEFYEADPSEIGGDDDD